MKEGGDEGHDPQEGITPEGQGEPVAPHDQTGRRGPADRVEGWFVGEDDALDPAAVGVSVGLVVVAAGYLTATRTGQTALAVVVIVAGGLIACAGLVYGLVRGGWGPENRPASGLVARLRATRAERDDARRQVRRLKEQLREARDGERRPEPSSTVSDGARATGR